MTAAPRLLEPLLSTMGQALSDFGGVRATRLTAGVATGTASLPVERTAGMPTAGQVLLGGVLYHYRGRAADMLTGIFTRQQGQDVPGTVQPHARLDAVTDMTGTYSQLDALRASYFVATASGEDLSVCGRNYGLGRDPSIGDEQTYRASLLTIAFGPRGTLYGLQTALDAMLGTGRYTLTEDPDNCRVQVTVARNLLQTQGYLGKSYLSAGSQQVAAGGSLPLPEGTQSVYGVFWAPEDVAVDCRQALPSASGDWAYGGSDAESDGTQLSATDLGTQLRSASAAYTSAIRMGADSDATLSVIALLRQTAPSGEGDLVLSIGDGVRLLRLCLRRISAGYAVLLQGNGGETVSPVALPLGRAFEVAIVKQQSGNVLACVNGRPVLAAAYASFPTSTERRMRVGVQNGGSSGVTLQRLSKHVADRRNYACAQGRDAVLDDALPQVMSVQDAVFAAGDVGRQVVIRGSQAPVCPPGAAVARCGTNDGKYTITAVDGPDVVHLTAGRHTGGSVGDAPAQRSRLDAQGAVFAYPQDVGKMVRIEGSSNAAGEYIIAQVLGPDSLAYTLPYPARGSAVMLRRADGSQPLFETRRDLAFEVLPRFADETGAGWQLADCGALQGSGTGATYATRQSLPEPGGRYIAQCNIVPGGTVLADELPAAQQTDAGPPPVYSVYPLYAADPFSYVQNYLNQLTAAGVRATLTLV